MRLKLKSILDCRCEQDVEKNNEQSPIPKLFLIYRLLSEGVSKCRKLNYTRGWVFKIGKNFFFFFLFHSSLKVLYQSLQDDYLSSKCLHIEKLDYNNFFKLLQLILFIFIWRCCSLSSIDLRRLAVELERRTIQLSSEDWSIDLPNNITIELMYNHLKDWSSCQCSSLIINICSF